MTTRTRNQRSTTKLTVRELSKDTWSDFERVLGDNGGSRGCWCMHWRLSIDEFMQRRGEGNRRAMRKLATKRPGPGVVVYDESTPVAWCSLGLRKAFPRLERSPMLAAVDDEPVCAITCIFVHRKLRGERLLTSVIDAVCKYAASADYKVVEGYPIEPRAGRRAGSDTAMTGIASAFLEAGFEEVARPRKDRPIMRRAVS
jgi:hypothetical protein